MIARHTMSTGPVPATPPFPDSYWILPGKLLAGEYPGAKKPEEAARKLQRLLDAGANFIVDLTEEGENVRGFPLQPYHGILAGISERSHPCEVIRCPMPDGGVPDSGTVVRALDLMDDALGKGKTVYIHCWGGHGRTGLVAGCWLRRHGLADADSVLQILARLRKDIPDAGKPSPETEGQRQMVLRWDYRE